MKKILIIEDEPNIRELILYNLKTNGYDGIAAEDGIMGITMVHRGKAGSDTAGSHAPGEKRVRYLQRTARRGKSCSDRL